MTSKMSTKTVVILFLMGAVALITSAVSSFADSTTYQYDDANRVIKVYSGKLGVTATAGSGGSISPSGKQEVTPGSNTSLTFTITPNTGYHIDKVLVDGVSQGAVSSYTFSNITESHRIEASFSINTYTLNVSRTTSGGTITGSGINCGNTCSATYNYGTQVTLTATPDAAHDFSGWSGDCSGTGDCTLTMNSNKSVTATLTIKPLTITTATNGLPPGTAGSPYSATLAATGGSLPYTWSIVSGSMPPGLSLNSSAGAISGTPTATGTYNFTVQVRDAGSVVTQKALTINILPDTTAPTGTISINSGAASTNSTSVTLNLTCSDSVGCSQMQFSNDNASWSIAEACAASKTWAMATGDGTKTVYVKFKDTAGNWSTAYSDTIVLDTIAPTTTASPAGGTYSTAQTVTLSCSDGTGGSGCNKIYYTTDGTTPTTASPAYSTPITISSTTTLKYFATDLAGNSEAMKSQSYTITGPDLTITAVSGPTSAKQGETILVSTTVQNLGNRAVNSFGVSVYLSTDATITTSDTLLGSNNTLGLGAGGQTTFNISGTIPSNLPPGTYYIGAIADPSNTVVELNESNNSFAGNQISIVQVGPDLTITAVSGPTSARQGQTILVSTTVQNLGNSAVSSFRVSVYLSTDATITTSDTLLGSNTLGIAAGGTSSFNISGTIPSSLPPGTYYIGAIADPSNAVAELNESNNAFTGNQISITP